MSHGRAGRPRRPGRRAGSAIDQHLGHSDHGGTDQHDEHTGENEEDQRNHDLDGGFGGAFLGQLAAAQPHGVGLDAQGRRNARAEFLGLDDHGGQGSNIVDTGARTEVFEHIPAGAPELELKVGDGEFLAEHR